MPRTALLDFAALLGPIPGADPAGTNLRFSTVVRELDEARKEDDPAMWGHLSARGEKPKLADWKKIAQTCEDVLKRQSKDLEVAARLAEALGKQHDLAGVRDGLRLFLGLHVKFWASYHPRATAANLKPRLKPFEMLDTYLATIVRDAPLTEGPRASRYSLRVLELKERSQSQEKSAEEQAAEEGPSYVEAIDRGSPDFYRRLRDDLRACHRAFRHLAQSNRKAPNGPHHRLSASPPAFVNLRKALDQFQTEVDSICEKKLPPEEAPAPEVVPVGSAEVHEPERVVQEETTGTERTTPVRAPRDAAPPAGPISSDDEARRRIVQGAAHLRRTSPTNPAPYLVVRTLRLGTLLALPENERVRSCEPPSQETRRTLVRLRAEEQWAGLLEAAEEVLGRPEGAGWLDADHDADLALQALGDEYAGVLHATRLLLGTSLRALPGWAEATFTVDRTPVASPETRDWLRDHVLPSTITADEALSQAATSPSHRWSPPETEADAEDGPDEASPRAVPAWERARDLVAQGQTKAAVRLLREALATAASDRQRFLLKLQLTELFLDLKNQRLALPLAEDLTRQVDEFRLERWEGERLAARAWAALCRCLQLDEAADPARRAQAFARLCRLDVDLAMDLDPDMV